MNKYSLLLILITASLMGCMKTMEPEPLNGSGSAPDPVTNISVENLPGGARITYTVPSNPDFSYVEAVFSRKGNQQIKTISSLFNNFVELEGFADTNEHEVKLYSVSRSEKRSAPVTVKFTPSTPPIETVYNTIQVREDFGGVNIQFLNEGEKEYVLYTLVKDSTGNWTRYDRLYSKAATRNYSLRGFEPEPTDFAFYLTDKWQNSSDTLFTNITPIYEELIEKNWKLYPLPGDNYAPHYTNRDITKIWDDNITTNLGYFIGLLPGQPLPHWFTIDLTKPYKFSRMKVLQYYLTNYAYNLGNPRVFEIWGSNDPPQDGSWNNWTMLVHCESIKPSGSGPAIKTAEDEAYAAAGEDYDFPGGLEAYRYIRFKTIETWGNAMNLLLFEITLWGQDPNKNN